MCAGRKANSLVGVLYAIDSDNRLCCVNYELVRRRFARSTGPWSAHLSLALCFYSVGLSVLFYKWLRVCQCLCADARSIRPWSCLSVCLFLAPRFFVVIVFADLQVIVCVYIHVCACVCVCIHACVRVHVCVRTCVIFFSFPSLPPPTFTVLLPVFVLVRMFLCVLFVLSRPVCYIKSCSVLFDYLHDHMVAEKEGHFHLLIHQIHPCTIC